MPRPPAPRSRGAPQDAAAAAAGAARGARRGPVYEWAPGLRPLHFRLALLLLLAGAGARSGAPSRSE